MAMTVSDVRPGLRGRFRGPAVHPVRPEGKRQAQEKPDEYGFAFGGLPRSLRSGRSAWSALASVSRTRLRLAASTRTAQSSPIAVLLSLRWLLLLQTGIDPATLGRRLGTCESYQLFLERHERGFHASTKLAKALRNNRAIPGSNPGHYLGLADQQPSGDLHKLSCGDRLIRTCQHCRKIHCYLRI